MAERQSSSVLVELDAAVARELVEGGNAEYYLAGDRNVGSDLVQVAIDGAGGVVAVVVIAVTKSAAKALADAVRRRHGAADHGSEVTAETASGKVVKTLILDEDGTALLSVLAEQSRERDQD